MTALSVVLDVGDGAGNPVWKGSAALTPSMTVTSVTYPLLLVAPVYGQFTAAAFPAVTVIPTDDSRFTPAGWGWNISFQNVPGNPAAFSFFAPAGPASFTAAQASPAVFTWAPTTQLTSLPNGTGVQLSGGSLPGGFAAGVTYYVVAASGLTVQLAATQGGSPIASTSTGSGQLTVVQYNLTALSPVSSVVTMAPFMPLPSGTPSAGQVPVATGAGEASAWETLSAAGIMAALTRAAVQTSNYTASANQVVPVDTTSGAVTVTLPNAPAAGALVAVKMVAQGAANTVTIACAGSDVFNKSGGSATGALTLLNQGMLLEYNSGIWTVLSDDLPLSQLLDGTASDIQPIGTSLSAGSTGKAADAGHVHTALGRLLNDRGAIAASTAYNPGDMVAYRGQRVLITTATTSSAWSPWFTPTALTAGTYIPITSEGVYYAADWGVVMDGVTDNSAALNKALQYMFDSNTGGFLVLPGGSDPSGKFCGVAGTVIIPPNCFIAGQGTESSAIKLLAGANCDVIQFQTYNSASQAAIITAATGVTITQGSVHNAFNSGLMHLTVDGNQGSQAAASYNYGVNMTTNPLTTAAPSDPGFDPTNLLLDVEVRGCTGDGLYHSGRGQLRVTDCVFRFNNGCGAIPSFDTIFTGGNFGGNGIGGVYVNHASCDGAANKSYNNGANPQWVSGSSYAAGKPVMYNGAMYRAINALTNDTVVPSSDPANWAALTANAPQAWGTGFYFDTNAGENSWVACDGQQNAASDYYIHGCTGVVINGVSRQPAFGAVSNPGNYSSVVLDGAIGCLVDVGFSQLNSVAYALRVVNSATRCDVRMTGDTTYAAILSPDSIALVGSGNSVRVNGAMLSDSVATVFTPTGLTGATAASRYVGATTSGAPVSGTFAVGDFVIDRTGSVWICTTAGSPGTWTAVSGGTTLQFLNITGLTGATAASRYVGATTGGAPASGTFSKGDFTVDETGAFWICTTAGSPGTWTAVSGSGGALTNPMTTPGDTIYGGAAGAATRLAGNTTTTLKALTQQGTGSASAAPSWSPFTYSGTFGDGSDGAVTMNGTNTYSGFATLAGSTYTLTRDVLATSLTVSGGVTLVPNGYLIFCTGTVTNSGTIGAAGNNASGATRGAVTSGGTLGPGEAGASGTSGNGAQGAAATASLGVGSGGASGAGSPGTAAATLSPTISTAWPFRKPAVALAGWMSFAHGNAVSVPAGGNGGGSGGGDGTNSGGGGGGGGPIIVILAWSVINNGTITCPGGNGGTPPAGNCGGGGGGGGGNIIIYTLTAWTAGTTNVAGGTAGSGVGTGTAGSAGGSGSVLNVIVQ